MENENGNEMTIEEKTLRIGLSVLLAVSQLGMIWSTYENAKMKNEIQKQEQIIRKIDDMLGNNVGPMEPKVGQKDPMEHSQQEIERKILEEILGGKPPVEFDNGNMVKPNEFPGPENLIEM